MFTPASPVAIRAFPAQLLRDIEPVAALAPTADKAERQFIANLAGRSVNALVLGRADDGRGIVDIDGHHITVAAELPPPGATVVLKFAGGAPLTAAGSPAAAHAAVPSAPDQGGASAPAGRGVLVQLRADAVSLGKLAQGPVQPLQLGAVAAPVEQPAQWSDALAGMVRDSGTFYESHLAAWTRGSYPLQNIQREPQAGAQAANAQPQNLPTAGSPLPATPAGATPSMHGAGVPASPYPLPTDPATPANPVPHSATTSSAVPDEWRPVVREQLHTLETGALPFGVEAWPGQRADLVISQEGEASGGRGGPGPASWKTSLKLDLPHLGKISATLSLSGNRLWLDLSAPAACSERLDEATGSLGMAMNAAGIELVRTRIEDDAP